MLHDPAHTTGLGHDLHRRGSRSGPDLTHKRAHTGAPYGLLAPHHQTPNTAIPTKTHTDHPATHQGVISQIKVRGAGVYVLQTHVSPVGGDIAQAELVDPVANPRRT